MRSVARRRGKVQMHDVIIATGPEPTRTSTRKRRVSPTSRIQNKRPKFNGGPTLFGRAKSSISEKGRGTPREEYLRADPDADVQGPALVVCRLCGTKISLSSRETHGAGRWDRHIKRCKIEQAERSSPDPDSSSTSVSQKPEDELHPPIRTSPGTAPLKLKVSVEGRRVAGDSVLSEDLAQSEYGAPPFETKGLQTVSPCQRSGYPETPSRQSAVNCDNVTTPSGMQEEAATVSIASPSDVSLDEVQGGLGPFFLDSDVTEPDRRWTDGAMTISPQDIVFRDKHGPCDTAVQSGVDDTSEGKNRGKAAVDATQLDGVVPLQERCEEGALNCAGLREESSAERRLCFSRVGDNNEHYSGCIGAHATDHLPSPAEDSDLDFEYPDWEPSFTSGTFEHELLAAGICLENFNHHYRGVEIGFNTYEGLRVPQHV